VELAAWGLDLLAAFEPIAAALDSAHQTTDHGDVLRAARALLHDPTLLPSARVLAVMANDFNNSFLEFTAAQSRQTRAKLLALPFGAGAHARFAALSEQSLAEQRAIEARDDMPFEAFRQHYLSPERLDVAREAEPAPTLVAV
jgi:glutamate--cysteine ligase